MSAKVNVSVYVPIVDGLTGNAFNRSMFAPSFEVLAPADSSVVTKSNTTIGKECLGIVTTDDNATKFIIRAYVDGVAPDGTIFTDDTYEDSWFGIDLSQAKGNMLRCEPVILGQKKVNRLREVEVTASKVMFYHKGDTLVYNADAFVLGSGSMLDALINQLPGVTLDKSGVIYCNGRKVDNLLLNGKDLFNGNRKLMLSNLAAYTVKDIAVYDKRGHLSEMFETNMGDQTHVMDVRLKREYRNGYIASVEAGYGTQDRYLGRLFGMWFSDFVSLSVNAGANNLSDESVPGKDDGAWSADNMGQGVSERQYGGINYFASGQNSKWEVQGDVQVSNSEETQHAATSIQSYLSSGDVFEYIDRTSRLKSFDVRTGHKFYIPIGTRLSVNFVPKFAYYRNDTRNRSVDVSLNDSLGNVTEVLLNAIYEDATAYKDVVNRYRNDNERHGHSVTAEGELYANIRLSALRATPMALTVKGYSKYRNNISDKFNRYVIKSSQESAPSYDANRYFKDYPDTRGTYGVSADFSRHLNPGIGHLVYEYQRYNETATSDVFLLHKIGGYDDFGVLPSIQEYAPTLSASDSYRSKLGANTHTLSVGYRAQHRVGGNFLNVSAGVPLVLYDRRLDYVGRGIDCSNRRVDFLPNVNVGIKFQFDNPKFYYLSIEPVAQYNQRPVDMIHLLDYVNATDPLNVYTGNPDLKSSAELRARLMISAVKQPINHKLEIVFTKKYNSLGQSYIYDAQTGVKRFQMQNVNGNQNITGNYYFFTAFGPQKRFHITTNTSADFNKSVDFMGIHYYHRGEGTGESVVTPDMTNALTLRSVFTSTFSEHLKIDWLHKSHRFSAHVDARFNRYSDTNALFENFNTWICTAGASAILNLPKGWGISSDFNMYMRRGYSDSRLNTTDLVWNARVTKSILNGSLMFILDGYDLLHQLSNVSYTINAQARTEIVTNVIPNYLLLHIRYNFNKQPKK